SACPGRTSRWPGTATAPPARPAPGRRWTSSASPPRPAPPTPALPLRDDRAAAPGRLRGPVLPDAPGGGGEGAAPVSPKRAEWGRRPVSDRGSGVPDTLGIDIRWSLGRRR